MSAKMGVRFFDESIVKGGFPPGSTILVAGEPGAGKTIFSSMFLYNGMAKYGEKAIYVSLAETKEDYYDEMKRLGMDFEEMERSGLFRFIDLITVTPETIEKEIELIMGEILTFRPRRIVIDSISAFAQLLGVEKTRMFLHTTLGRFVKSFGAVTLLVAEKPLGRGVIGYGVEEFVVDGVILLRYHKIGETVRRVMEIPKMRRRAIEKAQYEYVITSRGIQFLEVPDLVMTRRDSTSEKVTTGIPKLDELLDGGVYRGSVTLIVGMTGTGKTTFSLHFAVANALLGRKALYIGFEEPIGQLKRAARGYGLPIDDALKENLKLVGWVPEAKSPVHTFIRVKQLIEDERPDVLVLESLTALREHMDPDELSKMVRYLGLMVKEHNIAAYVTLNAETNFEVVPHTRASTLADNILGLKYAIVNDTIERRLAIIKARSSNHSRRIYRYEITPRGIEIYG
ncbi:circadian clock KaiC-like protein [Thermococcus sp. M36]|uniref:ATPase domain-containing protein n=1 Tax=Thermococcus sp. M36 TaxID=1638261 RepID=UPI00143C966F|nr:ATPase domain-containing protein [Thermococcus sp. M36]NJE04649.1 circadian clock KaiC-like protein [Thermococcus sp. M36]